MCWGEFLKPDLSSLLKPEKSVHCHCYELPNCLHFQYGTNKMFTFGELGEEGGDRLDL